MLTISNEQFFLHGQPLRIVSGALHYFRVVPEYWQDRLQKMRAFGLNTVETYVAWNLHEPRAGEFHFEGGLDIVRFIRTAADEGLNVIVRPGPYICAEWDFGGLPAWLLKDPNLQVRCAYPPYLAAVERFFEHLLPLLAPLQTSHGGPLIAMQVENEYGTYGQDKTYLQHLVNSLHQHGIDVLLFTSDGPRDGTLQGGTLPNILSTVNFAFNAPQAFEKLHQYQPQGPQMVTEFWAGWFDQWGKPHQICADGETDLERSVQTLDQILAAGASVNFYMFHGGTNFGFTSGANLEPDGYRATITSYDYAAPLSEAGDPNPRYAAYRQVLRKYIALPDQPAPAPTPKTAYGMLHMTERAALFTSLEKLSQPKSCMTPLSMEDCDQNSGFILYRTWLRGPRPASSLWLRTLHDRALVFGDGKPLGVLERETQQEKLMVDIPMRGMQLDLLVENMGRVNFGPGLLDRKGILGGVLLDEQFQYWWEAYPLPLDDLTRLVFEPFSTPPDGPAFYRTYFEVQQPADTFLALPGWSKGVAWINGFNLGRYWQRGPQRTLYIPAPRLRPGRNELLIFELHAAHSAQVELRAQAELG